MVARRDESERPATATSRCATLLALVLTVAVALSGCGRTATDGTATDGAATDGPTTDGTATAATSAADSAAASTTTSLAPVTTAIDAPGGLGPGEAGRPAVVASVVDGDTIEVDDGERVRLIGIDTPETKDPRRPVGCFGAEASARTSALLPPGTAVRLVPDVEPTDRYGRTLAYVVRAEDDLFINRALVAGGYALVATYPPNVAHVEELLAAQTEARTAGRGLWSACPDGDVPTSTTRPPGASTPSTPATAPTSSTDAAGPCDPAYPTLCLPTTPDLDCADLDARQFPVLAPDPHRLDGDGNGVGCEG